MILRTSIYTGTSFDPYYNLAVEQYLLETVRDSEIILYLWQNRNTVVIGRNQNAWKECRIERLAENGGRLTRRLSGGGAVFHDLGNLNFTFALKSADYDLARQQSVIVSACKKLGIEAELSGRNDILAGGRKFSGNSFYSHRGRSFHNGTLLVNADMDCMAKYLNPSKAKLEGKGVDSVRSRVVNLSELNPLVTIETLSAALALAFDEIYGCKAKEVSQKDFDAARIQSLTDSFADEGWILGKNANFGFSCEKRFEWGGVQLFLDIKNAVVADCRLYTDAMDHELSEKAERALRGTLFKTRELCEALKSTGLSPQTKNDLCALLTEQDI